MKKIKAVLIKPFNEREVVEIENTLEALQEAVGGYIEPVYRPNEIVMLVNEEGNLIGLEPNIFGLVGNILVVHNGGEDFISLSDDEIKEWMESD